MAKECRRTWGLTPRWIPARRACILSLLKNPTRDISRAPVVEEHERSHSPSARCGPRPRKVRGKRLGRRPPVRDHALLLPFPLHDEDSLLLDDLVEREPAQLRHPEPRRVRHFEHRAVPETEGVVLGRVEKPFHLLDAEHLGDPLRPFGPR